MTKSFRTITAPQDEVAALSDQEITQLRDLLSVARYDPVSGSLRIKAGEAKLLLRRDGTVRLEGRAIVQTSQGPITLNGSAISLN